MWFVYRIFKVVSVRFSPLILKHASNFNQIRQKALKESFIDTYRIYCSAFKGNVAADRSHFSLCMLMYMSLNSFLQNTSWFNVRWQHVTMKPPNQTLLRAPGSLWPCRRGSDTYWGVRGWMLWTVCNDVIWAVLPQVITPSGTLCYWVCVS